MANISFRYPKYVTVTLGKDSDGSEKETVSTTVKTLGKAISMNVAVNTADAELYADDGLAEYDTEFVDGNITLEVDDLGDDAEEDLLGASVGTDGDVLSKSDDVASYVRIGGVIGRTKSGVKQYRAVIYMRVKFGIPADNFSTKGQTISYGTPSLTGKVAQNHRKEWRYKSKWCDTPEAAETLLDSKLVVTSSPLSSAAAG